MEEVVLTLMLVLLTIFTYLQFKILKRRYPDESEVLGKDLPVKFWFMKDGKVMEVGKSNVWCKKCVYNEKYIDFKSPECTPDKRKYGKLVIFKQVKQELEKL